MLGVCGGYQMLGETLHDPDGSESGRPQTLRGLNLLPTETTFCAEKHRAQVTGEVIAAPFTGATLTGYEIHTAVSRSVRMRTAQKRAAQIKTSSARICTVSLTAAS